MCPRSTHIPEETKAAVATRQQLLCEEHGLQARRLIQGALLRTFREGLSEGERGWTESERLQADLFGPIKMAVELVP